MAVATRSSTTDGWPLKALVILLCYVVGYIIYAAVMATAAELLQPLLMISPLLIVIAVHWLSTMPSSSTLSLLFPGTIPTDIHRAGGSPWGVALVLLIVFVLISFQPFVHGSMS
ncbi:hypothetical protein Nepgr_013367 [Nepenthes gracilis]|uniref:Uncharacterized protein n=1 Tax=Nepenthes gracilis TaxID=150966 RepID=A0AAD3SIU8_NEPGR|nr:hypothetical protein Nepgr_013367 [Nepenthes gracilis]